NPLRAGVVRRAQDWRWSDLIRRDVRLPLADWPLKRPRHWLAIVNAPQDAREQAAVRSSIRRGTPLGSHAWVRRIAAKLNLTSTLRPRGRPKRPLETLSPRYRRRRERREAQKSG